MVTIPNKNQYRKDEHEAVFKRDNYMCRICGDWVCNKRASAAHLVPRTKPNIRDYGFYVINSRHNQWCTCLDDCNKKAQLPDNEETQAWLLVLGMIVKKAGYPIGEVLERKLQ